MDAGHDKSLGRLVRAGFWIYWGSVASNLSGFLYWMIITKAAGSEVLGLTTATVGLATLVVGLIDFGVGTGLQIFLGREREGSREEFRDYLWSTFYLRLALNATAGTVLLSLGLMGYTVSNYTPRMLVLSALFIYLSSLGVFGAYLTSVLRTDIIFWATLAGAAAKVSVGLALVLLGYGFTGAVLGYVSANIINGGVGLLHAVKNYGVKRSVNPLKVRNVVKAGVASYLPGLIALLGTWIGVVAVFGSEGAVSTGYYYVAFALFSVISMIGNSIAGLLLPYLSGEIEGRERVAMRVASFTLILVSPLAFIGMLYGWVLLGLLGGEYVQASPILAVLLLSTPALLIIGSIGSLVYVEGDYTAVFNMGLIQNIPRLLLYLALVPVYGGLGAAASFTAGSLATLPYSVAAGRRHRFKLEYGRITVILGVPGGIALLAYAFHLHWLIGSLLIASSYLAYGRMGLLTRRDVKTVLSAFVSEEKLSAYYNKYKGLVDLVLPPQQG